jgi:hypothetical protein
MCVCVCVCVREKERERDLDEMAEAIEPSVVNIVLSSDSDEQAMMARTSQKCASPGVGVGSCAAPTFTLSAAAAFSVCGSETTMARSRFGSLN